MMNDNGNDVPPVAPGGAPPVSIEAEPEREYEYLEDEDRVRIEYDGGRTNEMSFDEWGTRRATSAAVDHVRARLDDEGLSEEGIRVGEGVVDSDDLDGVDSPASDPSASDRAVDLGVIVSHSRLYSREGELIAEPDVTFESVVDVVPRSIEATMSFEEREYTTVLPVLCKKEEIRQTRG
jgi:hypothetical protein